MVALQSPGVVAEFPVPELDALPGDDAEYTFMSVFHWKPLLNGYSGVYPPSDLSTLARLKGFPSAAALAELRRDGVRYLVVHGTAYPPERLAAIQLGLVQHPDIEELGMFADFEGPAFLYALR